MNYRQCSFNLIKYELTFNKIHLPLAPLSNPDTLSKMHGLPEMVQKIISFFH